MYSEAEFNASNLHLSFIEGAEWHRGSNVASYSVVLGSTAEKFALNVGGIYPRPWYGVELTYPDN